MVTMLSAIFSSNLEPMSTRKEVMLRPRLSCGLAKDVTSKWSNYF